MTKIFVSTLIALTCATAFAQSVSLPGVGADVWGVGGDVKGVVVLPPTFTNYCDGRFTVWNTNLDVVVDNDSGLMWTKNVFINNTLRYLAETLTFCEELDYAGYTNWRLASVSELSRDGSLGSTNGLADAYPSANSPALPLGHPFINFHDAPHWTSTDAGDEKNYMVDIYNDGAVTNGINNTSGLVIPVRGP